MKTLKKNGKIVFKAASIEKIDIDLYAVSFEDLDQYKGAWRVYDYKQEKLLPGTFYNIWPFYNEVACVMVNAEPRRYNFISRDGLLLFQVNFDSCEDKIFKDPTMGAFLRGEHVKISITGGIDLPKRELAKLMLRE